jgi:hypothetical protein
VRVELHAFEQRYLRIVGVDDLEAQIAEALNRRLTRRRASGQRMPGRKPPNRQPQPVRLNWRTLLISSRQTTSSDSTERLPSVLIQTLRQTTPSGPSAIG